MCPLLAYQRRTAYTLATLGSRQRASIRWVVRQVAYLLVGLGSLQVTLRGNDDVDSLLGIRKMFDMKVRALAARKP